MIFSQKNIVAIAFGGKSESRRLKKPRLKVGHTYNIRTHFYDRQDRGAVMILSIRRERLGAISKRSIYREGCRSRDEFFAMFDRINKRHVHRNTMVYVVRFRYVGRE